MESSFSPRNRNIQYVFFDLGNTLIYFDGQFSNVTLQGSRALARSLAANGYPVEEEKFVTEFSERLAIYYREREADFIEDTTEYVLKSLLREYGYRSLSHIRLRAALDKMYEVSQAHWHAEDDAVSTLQKLQEMGFHLGIISNAADARDVQRLVDQAKLRPYLEQIIISAEVGIRKPHPRIFELALAIWGATPRQAVMVGDTLGADVLGALNVDMPSIWITRRASTPDNLAVMDVIEPDEVIETLSELPELLDHWNI